MKRAIEEYFPIVDVNRLAVPERNAFKPIYTMHKWFARRSSSVFRAILLGALKPAGTDIMQEFYKDHTNDPDTNGKIILDPFMGGGTTIVEALRLGCNVIGIDLNPVAWFIVKTEVEPVDLDELQSAFERLSNRTVEWSGKPLKETLLDLYKTECPACGNKDADTIYTFWVKLAPCTTATCNHQTPLFSDYIVSQKSPSIRYYRDCECPNCKKTFDWEIESASLIGNKNLMVNASQFSAGVGGENKRWSYAKDKSKVKCPWCFEEVAPHIIRPKKEKKKVPLSVLYCPHCEEVWQHRGEIRTAEVECPTCKHKYNPEEGNIPAKGKYICRGTCNGNVDKIISSIRSLPTDQLLTLRPYALEGYCEKCAGKEKAQRTPHGEEEVSKLFFQMDEKQTVKGQTRKTDSILSKNNGKFFKRFTSADLVQYQNAKDLWEKEKVNLPYPKSEIPMGEKTKSGLLAHHYNYWHQMFNDRQLLALATLLKMIGEEENQVMKEMLLSALFSSLEANNLFGRYNIKGGKIEGVFARHDYQPKVTICENNLFGVEYGRGTYLNTFTKVYEGKKFNFATYDRRLTLEGENEFVNSNEKISSNTSNSKLLCQSSSDINDYNSKEIDFVITDPPYAGNVNYSELADFFHVWLRLLLKDIYPQFQPEYTPKVEEVIENKTRGKSANDFKEGLKKVFQEAHRVSKDEAPLIFTFHHAEDSAWEALLDAVCEAGYFVEVVYPIHGEAENSLHLMNNEAISYDLIHVCKKRTSETIRKRSWAGVRQEIRQRAKEETKLIESGKYGGEKLSPSDINILLIGKCLELYSKHYGAIVDYQDQLVPLHEALKEIKMMVDQLITKERELPSELENIDVPSYIYFTALFRIKEIKVDEVSKSVRGIIEPSELREHGLIIKRRESRDRTFYVKQPLERLNDLKMKFNETGPIHQPDLFGGEGTVLPTNILLVDVMHLLLGITETGDNLLPWLEKFSGLRPQIRAAMEYFIKNDRFTSAAKRVLSLIDERSLFTIESK
jgi:adenine-specific DNA methylase